MRLKGCDFSEKVKGELRERGGGNMNRIRGDGLRETREKKKGEMRVKRNMKEAKRKRRVRRRKRRVGRRREDG